MSAARKQVMQVTPEADLDMAIDPWVTLNTAAQIIGKSRFAVLVCALDGKVRFRKVAGRRVFHRDDLETVRRDLNQAQPETSDDLGSDANR